MRSYAMDGQSTETGLVVKEADEILPAPSPTSGVMDESNSFTVFHPRDIGELYEEVQEEVPWLIEGYLAPGIFTLLVGPPKLGKTTFAYEVIASVAGGTSFLGREVQRRKVLLLGLEEHQRDIIARVRASSESDLGHQVKVEFAPLPYSEKVFQEIFLYIKQEDIGLVVVDTLPAWWNIEDENDAGKLLKACKPLLGLIRESGAAWLCLAHTRKGGGSGGDEIRGSTALAGLVDIAISMKRNGKETRRVLESISRYPQTPRVLVIERDKDRYSTIGTPAEVSLQSKAEKVLNALHETTGRTLHHLSEATDLSKQDVSRAIKLLGEGVRIEGKGVKNEPYLHYRNSIHPSSNSKAIVADDSQEISPQPTEVGQ